MLTSFPQSPKSPHSADVSACLRAVGTLFTWQKHRCAWGAFAEKTPSYPSPSLECYPSPSLEWPGTRLWWYFAPASPTGQGKVQEHRPLLPVFQFSLLWWKGLRRDRFRSIEAVNKKKKQAFNGMKERGYGFICVYWKTQPVTSDRKPANSSKSHPSQGRVLPGLQRNCYCRLNLHQMCAKPRGGVVNAANTVLAYKSLHLPWEMR